MELNAETSFLVSGYWERTHSNPYYSEFTLSKKVLRFIFKRQPRLFIDSWSSDYSEIDYRLEILDDTLIISRKNGSPTYIVNGIIVTKDEFIALYLPWFDNFPPLVPVFKHFCDSII